MRRAITDYNMISDGDKIVVGVSGGKDSLLLLTALKAFQRFSPAKFDLAAITIDMGFKDASVAEKQALSAYIALRTRLSPKTGFVGVYCGTRRAVLRRRYRYCRSHLRGKERKQSVQPVQQNASWRA